MGRVVLASTIALVAGMSAVLDVAGQARTPSSSDDPLASTDCRRAMSVLQEQEAAASGPQRPQGAVDGPLAHAPDPKFEAARRDAAKACLATHADPEPRTRPEPPAGRMAQPPVAVPPIAVAPPSTLRSATVAPPPPVARPPERPQFVVSCDPGGCWANDGSRLNRIGPILSGPRGVCTLQGALLTCP
jgi:hypothetical protein